MSSTMNLSLTDELKKFIQKNSGDGTLFSTPSEFVRDAVRERKDRMEAIAVRDGILEGYQDIIEDRVVKYKGNIRKAVKTVKALDQSDW